MGAWLGSHHSGFRKRALRNPKGGSKWLLPSFSPGAGTSPCEGPLATVPGKGSFKVREMREQRSSRSHHSSVGCSGALRQREGGVPSGIKLHGKPRDWHVFWLNRDSMMVQTDLNANENTGWDPRKLRCLLTGPPHPAPRLSFQLGLIQWKAPARGWGVGG